MQHGPRNHDTKLVGDIAVQHAILCGLQRGWGVLIPVGDRLPYDLVFDTGSRLVRIQVKSAYQQGEWWLVGVRRAKTNRKTYKFERYAPGDFDVALLWQPADQVFYVMPIIIFLQYRATIALPYKNASRERPNKARKYREAWHLVR